VDYYDQQAALARRLGDRRAEAVGRWHASLTLDKLGDRPAAIAQAEAALPLFEQTGDTLADKVRQSLAAWQAEGGSRTAARQRD